ncbi:protein belonging to Uncharacterized protein family UPF0286 [Candidatus Magnetobacterium bavaricum]|uniref:Protein belonging to Uncharacterized protein family UPF0286 n=1 Tax=Candidatus Magnetobacterium bavaricum TaxID=29290 RepID=A0A0F3GP45_9BACT|nr:protein belonging to Uncharacterized protein family UPF0286 [Candidatus Magnetobacterium bavaricum]
MIRKEKHIVSLLYHNPYLIIEENDLIIEKKTEVFLESVGRADIIFTLEGAIYIVEVKKGTLKTRVVDQVIRYIDVFKADGHKDVRGIIVGKQPPDSSKLTAYLEAKNTYRIKPLFLEHDIPIQCKRCSKCNRINFANAHKCRWCGEVLMKIW